MTKRRHIYRDPVERQATRQVARAQLHVSLNELLQRLPAISAQTLILLGLEQLSVNETATILGVSAKEIRKRRDHAISLLRSSIHQRSFDQLDEHLEVLAGFLADCDMSELVDEEARSRHSGSGCKSCGGRVESSGAPWSRGRPREYCSNACRQLAHRRRKSAAT